MLEEENVELRMVNGEDIMQYRNNVQCSYEEARGVFVQLKAQNEEINKSKTSGQARLALKLDICRIGELLKTFEKKLQRSKSKYSCFEVRHARHAVNGRRYVSKNL